MIAILTTEISAINLADTIHQYLTNNRPAYNAIRWQEVDKSDNEEKWCVFLAEDYPNPEGLTLVEALPENWRNPIVEPI